ncbi:MAG: cytochrome c oxidase subunit 3 [Acidimicrobiia bacterium]|nr:cytochrome c oxidase subunit 3 [Acidimicrobiia bacterium]
MSEHAAPATEMVAPAIAPRRRTLQVGTGFASAAVLMYFGGLLGVYFSERADFLRANPGESWIPSGVRVELTAPTVMAWTLLLSVVTMQWVVHATKRDDRRHTLIALVVTAMFGVAVINQTAFQYRQMGLTIDGGSLAAPLIYTISGSYLALVVVALGYLFVMATRTLTATAPSVHLDGISAAAMLWHVMVFVYLVIWVGIFVTK